MNIIKIMAYFINQNGHDAKVILFYCFKIELKYIFLFFEYNLIKYKITSILKQIYRNIGS